MNENQEKCRKIRKIDKNGIFFAKKFGYINYFI